MRDFPSYFRTPTCAPISWETAFRNGTLQGGYFILAARAVGLDCGPMSGFDPAKANAEFFPDGAWKANFLCNPGYGDRSKLFPRNPRLEFDEACRVLCDVASRSGETRQAASLHNIYLCARFLFDLFLYLRPGIFQPHGAVKHRTSGFGIPVDAKIPEAFELITALNGRIPKRCLRLSLPDTYRRLRI